MELRGASAALLQIFRYSPAFQKLIEALVRPHPLFPSGREFTRNVIDALPSVWVRQSAWDVGQNGAERLGRCVSSGRRLNDVLNQDGANNFIRFALCVTSLRTLKTDRHATFIQGSFFLAVSALRHNNRGITSLLRLVLDRQSLNASNCQSLNASRRPLVEAAGVEPASEKVNREKTTCVSGSVVLVRLMRYRQERGGLA